MSLSCSIPCDWTYDVFLSFRGIDTRNNFTSNLYISLNQRGINTFFDQDKIHKGDELTPTLLQAIKQSRIFIAIFSNNYASSTFCLTEWRDALHQAANMSGWHFKPGYVMYFTPSFYSFLFLFCNMSKALRFQCAGLNRNINLLEKSFKRSLKRFAVFLCMLQASRLAWSLKCYKLHLSLALNLMRESAW